MSITQCKNSIAFGSKVFSHEGIYKYEFTENNKYKVYIEDGDYVEIPYSQFSKYFK